MFTERSVLCPWKLFGTASLDKVPATLFSPKASSLRESPGFGGHIVTSPNAFKTRLKPPPNTHVTKLPFQ